MIARDVLFKELLAQMFQQLGVPLETEGAVRQVEMTIDAVARCRPCDRKRLAAATPFHFFTRHNLIEFKSLYDRLTCERFHRILSRAHLYAAEHKVTGPHDALLCIICMSRPT
jgi:hypothetical protein